MSSAFGGGVSAAPAEFYDARLSTPGTSLLMDLADSPYRELVERALALVPVSRVVELGCGTGRFARALLERGVTSYIGLDFAPGHIAEAQRYAPEADFRLADIRTDPLPAAETYVLLEVLEHLDDDLAVLGRIPLGARVVLSVPSFHSASHVRFFAGRDEARDRYQPVLRDIELEYVELPRGYFHLIAGHRA